MVILDFSRKVCFKLIQWPTFMNALDCLIIVFVCPPVNY